MGVGLVLGDANVEEAETWDHKEERKQEVKFSEGVRRGQLRDVQCVKHRTLVNIFDWRSRGPSSSIAVLGSGRSRGLSSSSLADGAV